MPPDRVLSAVLAEFSRVARAPLTAAERELRASSLLTSGVTLQLLRTAIGDGDLEWNRQQAEEHGIDAEAWLRAVHIADLPRSASLGRFLDGLHRAEAIAAILKAGYQPGRNNVGHLVWSVR
jgi:hypothetical protein